jgi:hypothetical protein
VNVDKQCVDQCRAFRTQYSLDKVHDNVNVRKTGLRSVSSISDAPSVSKFQARDDVHDGVKDRKTEFLGAVLSISEGLIRK